MEIHKITTFSFPISTFRLPRPAGFSNSPSGEAVNANVQGENRERNITRLPSDFIDLQKINDTFNAIARIQRGFEKHLQKLDDYLERMKAQLEQIVKQFPPFPPGSGDRVRALRAYAYFRNLIDQLTIPPPDEAQIRGMKELINTPETSAAGEKNVSGQLPNPIHPFDIQISS